MSEVNITTQPYDKIPGATMVIFDGTIDTHTVHKVEDVLGDLIDEDKTKLILDGKGLNFISSAGLGAIMAAFEDIEDADENGFLKIINLSDDILDIFNTMGFADLLEIYSNEEELLSSG